MSVAELLLALHGHYEPTGVYSFEFKQKGDGKKITEIFLILPPESVKFTEPQRSMLMPTLTGGYYVDYGNEFKEISISGSSHFYYAGSSRNPSKEYGRTLSLGLEEYIDGYSEFLKLRFMLSRYRDYTLTKNGKLKTSEFGGKELASTKALKNFVNKQIESGKGALADQIDVIFHDYDYDDHWYVRINSLSMSRSKDDPWTVTYNLSMQGYEQDTKQTSWRASNKPSTKKLTPAEQFRRAYLAIGQIHLYSTPDELPVQTASGVIPIANKITTEIPSPIKISDLPQSGLPSGL